MQRTAEFPPINQKLAEVAESLKPKLIEEEIKPLTQIVPVRDDSASMGWRSEMVSSEVKGKVLKADDEVILDFGGHHVGYLSFDLVPYKYGLEPNDSPCRLYIVFGEILTDVAEDLEPYTAWLSKAWLPDELVTIDFLPQRVDIQRRHAFRYVRIKIIATSPRYGVKIENPIARTVSCISPQFPSLDLESLPLSLSNTQKDTFHRIDKAALVTLRNCMQTVYEDGPRRDQRLWIGDLRLQALCNYSTFGDFTLVKRCLYLFAACPVDGRGLLSACVYESPTICTGGISIVDYAHLFAVCLYEYVVASGDVQAGKDLFEIAKKQFDISLQRLDPGSGMYVIPIEKEGEDEDRLAWHFIDWHPELEKTTSEHCILIYCLRSLLKLSKLLDLPEPTFQTSYSAQFVALDDLIEQLVESASSTWSTSESVYVSGPEKQISWASNAWAVLAGLPKDRDQAATCLKNAYLHPRGIIGTTPYLHHYLVEAMIEAGLTDLAIKHIEDYWGSMIEAGAESFWEAWDPKKPKWSPYGDVKSNSFCHAWSCTPAWLLRKLLPKA